jgi:hypothetical protein
MSKIAAARLKWCEILLYAPAAYDPADNCPP